MKRVLSRIADIRRPVEAQVSPGHRNNDTQESQLSHEDRDGLTPDPQPELSQDDVKPPISSNDDTQESKLPHEDRDAPILNHQPQQVPQEDITPPISRLPNEILADIIFMLVVESNLEKGAFFITHVCRHWRDVALGAPLLWAKPRTTKYERVKLMLERSHPADLDIVMESRMPLLTAQALVNCMWRVASLRLLQGDRDERIPRSPFASLRLVDIILNRVTEPARRLKMLEVTGSAGETNRADVIALLQRLQPDMAQLRQLSLGRASIDWSIFPLNKLVRLHLRDIRVADRISIQTFIAILGQMPSLESISFILGQQVIDSNSSIAIQPVKTTFPALQYLKLDGSTVDFVTYFLAHTASPRLRRMSLELSNVRRNRDTYLAFVRALATTVKTGNFGIFNTFEAWPYLFDLSLAEDPHASQQLTFTQDIDSPIHSSFALSLASSYEDHAETGRLPFCPQLIEDLIGLLGPLLPARIVDVKFRRYASAADFEQFLNMPYYSPLKTMTIEEPAGLRIIPALTRLLSVTLKQDLKEDERPFHVSFPDLKTILFKWGILTDVKPDVWEAMCDCLALRRIVGFPLQEFILGSCVVTEKQYTSLAKAVTVCTRESRSIATW